MREAKADPPSEEGLDPEAVAERRQLCEALEAALAELDPAARELVVRRYCEGRSAAELSEEMSIPASTVRTQISRSLALLRKHLDRTYGGRGAWMTAAVAWRPLSTTALIMSSTTKLIAIALTTAAVALGCVAYQRSDTSEAPQTAQAQPADRTPRDASKLTRDRRSWNELRDAINEARTRRGPSGKREKSVLEDDPQETLAELQEALDTANELGPTIGQVVEQGVPLFVECLEFLPDDATGKLHLRAQLLGEPGLGGIVESVEVVDDSLDQPELEECLRESTYAIRIDGVEASLSQAINITVDMEDRSLSVQTNMDLANFAKLHRESPELWAQMLEEVDSLDPLIQLVRQPDIAQTYPDLVAAIERAAAEAKE